MATDPRGRWFRVYAPQLRRHVKFRDLSLAELGAWTDLRGAVEIMGGEPFVDREDALRVLRRRESSRAKCSRYLDRLIEVRLLDAHDDGAVAIHDLTDHDRQRFPSDDAERVRERVARSRAKASGNEPVTTRYSDGNESETKPVTKAHARQSRAEADTEAEAEPAADAMLQASELPSEFDSATLACRQLFDWGKWLGDREYVAAWEDMDHRYSAEWVQSEIAPAFAACLEKRGKVLPWDLKRMTEQRLAERTRAEEREREHRQAEADRRAMTPARVAQTPEEIERQSLFRRAIGVWIKGGRKGKVPEKVDELREWLTRNGAQA